MSKYFDKLVKINESLDRNMRMKGLVNENVDPDNPKVKEIKDAGLSVGFNTKGIEVSFADEDEETCKKVFQQTCDELDITPMLKDVNTEKLLTGEYVTYGTLEEWNLVQEDNTEDEITIPKDALTDDQKKEILIDKGVDQKTVDSMKDSDEIATALDATLNTDNVEQKNESADDAVYIRMDDDDLEFHGYVKMTPNKLVKIVDSEEDADVFETRAEAEKVKKMICDTCSFDPATLTFQDVVSQTDDDGENWMSLNPDSPGATVTP